MKRKLAAFVSIVILAGLFGITSPAQAGTSGYSGIGVTGGTLWISEYHEALARMNGYGIPIHDGCFTGDLCVHMGHYSQNDGQAGYAVMAGNDGSVVRFNTRGDRGRWYRLHLMMHEFGHHAGLDHSNRCDSSMYHTIPACNIYILGYTPQEQQRLRELWG